MELSRFFRSFFESERSGGFVLLFATVLSLLLANVFIGHAYPELFERHIGFGALNLSIEKWVNDGLMAIFFLLVGLEIERELYVGELSLPRQALLPIVAAIGGMLVPAALHYCFNRGLPTERGFGIPMATDIAFALGVLSLAGKRVPPSLKVFLAALAIIDDLGAISVIALFYSHGFSWFFFAAALAMFGLLYLVGRLGVRSLTFFLLCGVVLWYFMLRSGVHASIAGVLLAFAIPFDRRDERSNDSHRLQMALHKPVAFLILPVFALVNTAILIPPGAGALIFSANGAGIAAGLIIGKFVGIFGTVLLAGKLGFSVLPAGASRMQIAGIALLGGIGFTMSIFITNLAFGDAATITGSKLVILLAALVSAVSGLLVLRSSYPKKR